jgi:predicted lactoylglutathione lyase
MPGVRQVAVISKPSFLATNQFKLNWQHFTMSPSQPVVNGTPAHATVAMVCEFDFLDGGDITVLFGADRKWRLANVIVKALMIKSKSYVHASQHRKNSSEQNAILLLHERVHVELAERHARSIWKHIQQLKVAAPDAATAAQQLVNAADAFSKTHWQKLATMNAMYDRETDHGRNQNQKKWNQLYLTVKNTNSTL